jgi:bifunctional lysine-specific demethylase and histidyl-hydroxylase NO66
MERMDPFELIFAPVDEATFTREYYSRAALHVSRNDPARFAAIYGVDDVEEALAIGSRETSNFAIVKTGSPQLPLEHYAPLRATVRANYTKQAPVPTIDARKVAEFFGQGWTLVIKDAALFGAHMQQFCNALQSQTGWYVQPNVYLTPASAQGFGIHYDTHDTTIVQIEGEKTWRIYEPVVQLPIESQPFSGEQHRDKLRLHREVKMQPGDTLYIPGGFPHEAVSLGTRTLHVTFAALTTRVIDLLEQMLALAATQDVELRRTLPLGWHRDPGFAQTFLTSLAPNLSAAFSPARIGPGAERLMLEYFGASRIDARDAFERVEATTSIDGDTRLRLRTEVPHAIAEGSPNFSLMIPGRSLLIPSQCLDAVRRLEHGPARVAELPSLADVNQLWLARLLLTYGVVEIADESSPS